MVLFKKTKKLELKMEEFLDTISESGIIFQEGIQYYLKKKSDQFEQQISGIREIESRADRLRHTIEQQLYTETLIPESRGDVLALLETADDVINQVKSTLLEFSVEMPSIPEKFHEEFLNLTDHVVKAVDEMSKAIRAFLNEPKTVRNYTHKVYHYEREADRAAERLKRSIFSDKQLELSKKIHLRYFALHVDTIADRSEDVADRLGIYTIKRTI
jgi:predicted phosphate transport protein (TIGR00153 family)